MKILGIETSCDDTSCAILDDNNVLSSVRYSQTLLHQPFGGVVPEIASRDHIKKLPFVLKKALEKAKVQIADIKGVAVTNEPGLIGALLVGVAFAKALAYDNNIPIIGVNHLKAHLYSAFLEHTLSFPFIGLTVSGGHTSLNIVEDFFQEKQLGVTLDDAAGEAFDKVAKILGLNYPGGPEIEKLAEKGNSRAINFPKPLFKGVKIKDEFNFSFSGLKSAVVNYVNKHQNINKTDVAASFQRVVIEILTERLVKAAQKFNIHNLVVAGGVACNKSFREFLEKRAEQLGLKIFIPSVQYCTDNAAMIAYLGKKSFELNEKDDITLGARAKV